MRDYASPRETRYTSPTAVTKDEPAATSIDRLLSERMLYPILAMAFLVLTIVVVARKRDLGPAPDLDLPTITADGAPSGERVSLRGLRGKVVLVDFWATWCGPCRVMTPVLQRMHTRYAARGLAVVGVNVDEDGPGIVPRFRQHYGVEYPMVYDVGMGASARYEIRSLPTLLVIDRDGHVRYRHSGTESEAELASLIEGLL